MKKAFSIGVMGVFIDQVTKMFVLAKLKLNDSVSIIANFFNLTYIKNTGGAFGLFSNGTIILAVISIAFICYLVYYFYKYKLNSNLYQFILGLLLAGVIGNLIDRLVKGYVIDFLDFKIFGYDFPIFNVADIFVVCGMLLFILVIMKEGDGLESKSQ